MRLRQKFRAHVRKSHYPTDRWTSFTIGLFIIICFKMYTTGPARFARSGCRKAGIHFASQRTSKDKQPSYSTICNRQTISEISILRHSQRRLAELNAIHAFREGNGRSQLSFFALLADYAGHPLKIEKMNPEEMLAAMIASFDGNERYLVSVIRSLIE